MPTSTVLGSNTELRSDFQCGAFPAQVPGLFEGDEYATLMTQCKEGAQKEGLMLDTHEELYKWFTSQVIRNLHVVFTMNPSSEGLKDRAATSPALFNRCEYDFSNNVSIRSFSG